jgi:rhodanese-related sulfurtransferase
MNTIKTFSSLNGRRKIIDVQDRYEYNISHIPGSINIPYDELISNYRVYLNKNDTYYLYCKSGKLSKRASIVLNYLGYNTFVLEK